MKCEVLCSGENKKYGIYLPSLEFVQRVVKVNTLFTLKSWTLKFLLYLFLKMNQSLCLPVVVSNCS